MNTEKILVRDNDDIIEITYEDILKYHGKQMIGGAALAFKIMLMTFPKLSDDIPKRGDFSFYSGIGANGRGIILNEFMEYSKLAHKCKKKMFL